ncbi:hypothetical protein KIK06_01155 [Nocardiopsis sp. EMB25]|uniref:toxin-antitoxin system YwqK family antitoxin n=1 Tax=Nocardiopsis sp. EMB25 TaxID=2835867 RepID=UPI0022847F0B|nr:hypothetical protein [Nocardiopsis sp. EMB25]MCY9782495.1 hypothetical protein [Nocardiopsis sp. EMB25]
MRRVTSDETRVDAYGTVTHEGAPFTGVSVSRTMDGRLEESVAYLDGVEHGPWLEWYPDGTPRAQGQCDRHLGVVGLWREWHPNGRISLEEVWTHVGHLTTSRAWDERGALVRDSFATEPASGVVRVPSDALEEGRERLLFEGAPFTGEAFTTNAPGLVVALDCYVDGTVEGARFTWHPNGLIRSEEHVRGGVRVGTWRRWSADGRPTAVDGFDDTGALVRRERWEEGEGSQTTDARERGCQVQQ